MILTEKEKRTEGVWVARARSDEEVSELLIVEVRKLNFCLYRSRGLHMLSGNNRE